MTPSAISLVDILYEVRRECDAEHSQSILKAKQKFDQKVKDFEGQRCHSNPSLLLFGDWMARNRKLVTIRDRRSDQLSLSFWEIAMLGYSGNSESYSNFWPFLDKYTALTMKVLAENVDKKCLELRADLLQLSPEEGVYLREYMHNNKLYGDRVFIHGFFHTQEDAIEFAQLKSISREDWIS